MKALRTYALLLLVAAFAACATVPAPRSAQDGVAYGYAALASARHTNTSRLQAGQISVNEAREVQALEDDARLALDHASALLAAGAADRAQVALLAASALLARIDTILNKRE